MYRSPQARNQGGEDSPRKIFSPHEKCVGCILIVLDILYFKNLSPSQKTLRPRYPKLVTGLEVQKTFGFPFSLLRHYQIPECFCVNESCF